MTPSDSAASPLSNVDDGSIDSLASSAAAAYAAAAGIAAPQPNTPPSGEEKREMGVETDYKSVIKVSDPELRGTHILNKHHAYKITAPNSGVSHVFRRYKDFDWLRSSLVRMYPGMFVPPLPPKKMMGSLEESFVAERRVDLERFLNRVQQAVAPNQCLASSPMFKMFVNRTATFDDGVKEQNKMLDGRTTPDVINEYNSLFPEIMKREIEDRNKVNLDVAALFEFLLSEEEKLTGLHASARSLLNSANAMSKDIGALAAHMDKLATLEKGFPDKPPPARVEVHTEFAEWTTEKKNMTAAIYNELVSAFKYELMDIEAFLDVLKFRQTVVVRRNKAVEKAKVWKLPETLVDTEKKEQQKTLDLAAEKDENDLVDAITKLILYSQTGLFWRHRMSVFRTSMSRFAKAQAVFTQRGAKTWAAVFTRASDGLSEQDMTRSINLSASFPGLSASMLGSDISGGAAASSTMASSSSSGAAVDPDL